MSPPKPAKLQQKLEDLRRKGSIKSTEIESFAKTLGRKRHKRGSEPTWINPLFPELRPVTIPHHSKGLNKITARAILGQLEADVEAWENALNTSEEEPDA